MGKTVNVPKNAVLFTSLKKFESRNNIVELISAFRKVAKRVPNAFLLLKDEEWRTSEQRGEFEKIVQEVQHEPWFLWERKRDPLSTIMSKHLPASDVSLVFSGLEAASTSTIDTSPFGIPLVTLDASTHPYLFKNGALFVRSVQGNKNGFFNRPIPVPEEQHLVETLVRLAQDQEYREVWGRRARRLAETRFRPSRSLDRFLLAARAAEVYRKGTEREKQEMRRKVAHTLERDLREFGVHR